MIGWLILVILAAAAAAPFVLEARRAPPDSAKAPGKFADLPTGRTHYRWLGPARGPVVVAIHGLRTSSEIWEEIAEGLGRVGYRTLVYDLHGRGFSEAPRGPQTSEHFIGQLEALLAVQEIGEGVSLLGYSMGGGIAVDYAAKHPEQVDRLMLVAPTGIEMTVSQADRFARDNPVLGDWLALGPGRLKTLRDVTRQGGRSAGLQLRDLRRKGYVPAILSSARHMLGRRQEAEHRAIGRAGIPVLAVWGEVDEVVPIRGVGTLAQWNRTAKQETVPGAGHGLVETHAEAVLSDLRLMLRGE